MLIALPQCDIAHAGSAFAISPNCRSASGYQKSCSNATPRLKDACTDGAQVTAKDTVPRRSCAASVDRADWSIWPTVDCATEETVIEVSREIASIFIATDYRMIA